MCDEKKLLTSPAERCAINRSVFDLLVHSFLRDTPSSVSVCVCVFVQSVCVQKLGVEIIGECELRVEVDSCSTFLAEVWWRKV